MKNITFIFLWLICYLPLIAQNTFKLLLDSHSEKFGNGYPYEIHALPDSSGYLVLRSAEMDSNSFFSSRLYLTKIDTAGNLMWDQKYAKQHTTGYGADFLITEDSNLMIVGAYDVDSSEVIKVIKTDMEGDTILTNNIQIAPYWIYPNNIITTNDGNYIISGIAYRNDTTINNDFFSGLLIKIDENGDTLWTKVLYPDNDKEEDIYSIVQDAANNFLLLMPSFSGDGTYLVKTDSSGNVIWKRAVDKDPDNDTLSPVGIYPGSNNNYIISGNTYMQNGANEYFLMKTDTSANITWYQTYSNSEPQLNVANGGNVTFTRDNGYLIMGYSTDISPYTDLIKLDSSGNKQWSRTFQGIVVEGYYGAKETYDGGYIMAGFTLLDQPDQKDSVIVMKVNNTGNFTAVKDLKSTFNNSSIKIYPNPTDNLVMITSPQNEIKSIQLYNIAGMLINSYVNPVSNFAQIGLPQSPGLYLIEIKTENGTIFRTRIIKQ